MAYTRICVAVALQRYLDITPIAARLRDLAGVLAVADNAPVTIVTVEAPVELLPDVETTEEKLQRLATPLRDLGLMVNTNKLEGRPSEEITSLVKTIAPLVKKYMLSATCPVWKSSCFAPNDDDLAAKKSLLLSFG